MILQCFTPLCPDASRREEIRRRDQTSQINLSTTSPDHFDDLSDDDFYGSFEIADGIERSVSVDLIENTYLLIQVVNIATMVAGTSWLDI